jgi:hypothetical protein
MATSSVVRYLENIAMDAFYFMSEEGYQGRSPWLVRSVEERLKTVEEKLRSFIERPNRQYSPEERAKNKRLLDDLRLAMVEYSETFEQAVRS